MKMKPDEYVEYKRREFCKDVKCPVQMELNKLAETSPIYEQTRQKCSRGCLNTTWQFHHWLIEKGYIILVSLKLKNNERTILANINKELAEWIDQQDDKNSLVEKAIAQYKKNIEST